MPYDGMSAFLIAKELDEKLTGSRIHKIYQPVKDEIVLYFSDRDKSTLLLCANPSFPRANLISDKYDNPSAPPSFCMLLRKYLLGAVVKSVTTYEFDRIMILKLENLSGASMLLDMSLILEIMGRHSNLILVNNITGAVIDSIKHVNERLSSVRQVLPGLNYSYPPNIKLNPLKNEYEYAAEKFYTMPEKNVSNALLETFTGVSNQLAMSFVADNEEYAFSLNKLSKEALQNLPVLFCEFIKNKVNNPSPILYLMPDGSVKDFCIAEYSVNASFDKKYYASMNEATEAYYRKRVVKSHINEKYSYAIKKLETLLAKEKNKMSLRQKELINAENAEEYNIKGNLLFSNLNAAKKGDRSVTVKNYYSPDQPDIVIELNPALSITQNAQKYFKKYTKAKNAKAILDSLITQCSDEIYYLSSQLLYLKDAADATEADEIIVELIKRKIIKAKKLPVKTNEKPSKPREFLTDDGYVIYVGKNDRQNDRLTFKSSQPDDIWLHVKNAHGSHVVIKTQNKSLSDHALELGAKLAVYYSDLRQEKNASVDYTFIKYVKKPSSAALGRVIYTDYKTVNVTCEENMFLSLK